MNRVVFSIAVLLAFGAISAAPQSGSSGSITGTVADPSGATVAVASVQLQNHVTGYEKTVTTDATGAFRFIGIAQKVLNLRGLRENLSALGSPI